MIVVADAQWHPLALGIAVAGLLLVLASGPLDRFLARLGHHDQQARHSLLNRERAEEIERWYREGGPEPLQRVTLVLAGLLLGGAGLGLFLGILPSD